MRGRKISRSGAERGCGEGGEKCGVRLLPSENIERSARRPLRWRGAGLPTAAVQPMEGCDGTPGWRARRTDDGGGTAVLRAVEQGLIWFEAVAVSPEARANPASSC